MLTQSLLTNMTQSESIYMSTSLFILVAILISFLTRSRYQGKPLMKYMVYWIIIGLALILIYSFKEDAQNIIIRYKTTLMPSFVIDKDGELIIKRSSNGHFIARAQVNGATVNFLIDTGATSVLLTLQDAIKGGIDTANLSYTHQAYTANGISKVAKAKATLRIGGLEFADFPVLISASETSTSLLGMSFINQFKNFNIQQDTMRLIYH